MHEQSREEGRSDDEAFWGESAQGLRDEGDPEAKGLVPLLNH